MSTSYKTHKPSGLRSKINRRAAAELGVRALWSAQESLRVYDLIQTEKFYEPTDPVKFPVIANHSTGVTNFFRNQPDGQKLVDEENWIIIDGAHVLPGGPVTHFAALTTVVTTDIIKFYMVGGGLRSGYKGDTNQLVMGSGLANFSISLPHPLNDGQLHTLVTSFWPGHVPRLAAYFDGLLVYSAGGLGGQVLIEGTSNFVIGGGQVGEQPSWLGQISIAGQSETRWILDSALRFAESPFELLYGHQRRFAVEPSVLPPGQIDARFWSFMPVVSASGLVVEPTLQARNLQTLPVVDADDIDVEPVVGSRELHTLPVVDDD